MAEANLKQTLGNAILNIPGVSLRSSRFSDNEAFFLDTREFAHFHAGNEIDIRLTRQKIRRMAPTIQSDTRYQWQTGSDWLTVSFANADDMRLALDLVEQAATLYR